MVKQTQIIRRPIADELFNYDHSVGLTLEVFRKANSYSLLLLDFSMSKTVK